MPFLLKAMQVHLWATFQSSPNLQLSLVFSEQREPLLLIGLLVFPQEIYQAEQYVAAWWDLVGDP